MKMVLEHTEQRRELEKGWNGANEVDLSHLVVLVGRVFETLVDFKNSKIQHISRLNNWKTHNLAKKNNPKNFLDKMLSPFVDL